MLTRIVTCYRQWDLISRWLGCDSLFVPEVRWLIINDSPTDPCPIHLAEKLEKRGMEVVTPEFNRGRSGARNLGAARAESEWIEFIDGDDIPLPLDLSVLGSPGGSDIVAFPVLEHQGETPPAIPTMIPPDLEIKSTWADYLPSVQPLDVRPAGLLWRRSFFLQLGGFDSRFESAEDFHLVLRAGWVGGRVSRSSVPKQYYCVPSGNHNFSPLHIEGHRRLFEWIQANSPCAHPVSLDMWLAKECVYEAFVSAKRGLRRLPGFLTFLSRR